jgi:hypothetical protein
MQWRFLTVLNMRTSGISGGDDPDIHHKDLAILERLITEAVGSMK